VIRNHEKEVINHKINTRFSQEIQKKLTAEIAEAAEKKY